MAEAQGVVIALDHRRVTLELADHRARVEMVDPEQPAPLRDHAERHSVVLLPRVSPVAGAVEVEDHAVAPGPLRHRLHRRVTDGQVHHDDDAADLLGELGPLVHVLHGRGGHVHVVTLDLTARGARAADALDRVQVTIAPAHERLRVDVLVVLGEVEPAAQRLKHHPAVVLGRQAELRLDRGAEQRAPELVEILALHHDPVRRALEGLDVLGRDPQVLEAAAP